MSLPVTSLKIEKTVNSDQNIEFEVLAVSGEEGKIARSEDAKVVGEILGEGRADKILVFHFKRKKQYKKLNGHRQPFTAGADCGDQRRRAEALLPPRCRRRPPKAAKA